MYHTIQSRVISVHSWYLTSLVNLSFCRIDASFRYLEIRPHHHHTTIISLQREAHLCGDLFAVDRRWLSPVLHSGVILHPRHSVNCLLTKLTEHIFLRDSLSDVTFAIQISSIINSGCIWRPFALSLGDLPVHWYHLFVSIRYHKNTRKSICKTV